MACFIVGMSHTPPGETAKLPDPEICRTQLEACGLHSCLVRCAAGCPHFVKFGWGRYCTHPNPRQFSDREQPAASVAADSVDGR
jgi:hypothetical protein